MKTKIVQLVVLITFIFTASLVVAAQTTFEICGTGDSQVLLSKLADAFIKNHPNVSINIPDSIGSSGGIRKVALGKCELGRVARKFKENEQEYNLKYKLFAYSAVTFITSKNVTINTLSTKLAISILNGQMTSWQDAGGHNAPIYIAKRERGDSSRSVLEKNIPPLKKLTHWAGKTMYTTKEAVETVRQHKNTISFAPLSMSKAQDVRILKYNDVSPSPANIKTGKYPLVVSLGLVWKGELDQPVQDFVDFVFSRPAQAIITNTGAIPAQ